MILFSLYLLVSATSLVQSLPNSAGRNLMGNQRTALTQSKASVRQFVSNKNDVFNKDLLLNKAKVEPDVVQKVIGKLLEEVAAPLNEIKRELKTKHSAKVKRKRAGWDKWTEWSPCSVSCGRGRVIRWRHCIQNCAGLETEMDEKACQLPACGGKLFGLINL